MKKQEEYAMEKETSRNYKVVICSEGSSRLRLYGEFDSYEEAYREAAECIPDESIRNISTEDTDVLEKLVIVETFFENNVQFFKPVFEWCAK